MRVFVNAILVAAAIAGPARADDRDGNGVDDDLYLVPHPAEKWWFSGQLNIITQAQPGFHSPYKGDHSLRPDDYLETSFVLTAYAAYEVTPYTAIMISGESTGGAGLSTALGLAGFSNLDVVRNPQLGPTPYVARALVDQIIPLSSERVIAERLPFDVLRMLPTRRIELRAGKMSTVDMFDNNDIATDSHRQFLNWAIDNTGSYDYAADTRGYSLGASVEYADPRWAIRYGMFLMPKVANGIDYDFDLPRARGEQLELELHECLAGHPGTARLLGFLNHAKMGSYDEAIAEYRTGIVDVPDITSTRSPGRTKYGLVLNLQQQITGELRAFARLGWSDGANESFAYTEIDNTIALGIDLRGAAWGRDRDQLGLAAVTSGLSSPHRTYLMLGGDGFLLGDGKLRYGREQILEMYYTAQLVRGVFPALDVQVIDNPGFNRDRGPVFVISGRLHMEL